MGPIQTALNKLVGSVSAAVVGGAKLKDHEGQIREEEAAALKAERAKKAAEKKEAAAVATEADLRNLGASDIEARAYRLAQERGIANPKRMIFDKEGKPIATYEEMATLLADNSLSGTLSSRLRGKKAVKLRRELLSGKTHEERVQDALLSIGGGK